MTLSLLTLTIVFSVSQPPLEIHSQLADQMTAGVFSPTQSQPNVTQAYRLFEPRNQRPGEKYPLVIWLHGYGHYEYVHPNVGQLQYAELVFSQLTNMNAYRFYFLAAQLRPKERWFSSEENEGSAPADVLVLLVRHVCTSRSVDVNRIYLVGISAGGTACWTVVARHPTLFAAVASMAGQPTLDLPREALDTPIWAFVSERDPTLDSRVVKDNIATLGRKNASVHLTIVPGGAHNCWGPAFQDHNLLAWMMKQRRGSRSFWLPPCVLITVLGVSLLMCWTGWSRCRNKG